MRRLISPACLLVLAAALLGGCADARTAWVRNETDVMLRVRFWCGPREGGMDPRTLKPGEVFDVEPGKIVRVRLQDEEGFESEGESIVRLQVEPMHASFRRIVHYWFELDPPGPYGAKAVGARPNIRVERDGPGTLAPVPGEHWATEPE